MLEYVSHHLFYIMTPGDTWDCATNIVGQRKCTRCEGLTPTPEKQAGLFAYLGESFLLIAAIDSKRVRQRPRIAKRHCRQDKVASEVYEYRPDIFWHFRNNDMARPLVDELTYLQPSSFLSKETKISYRDADN